MRISDTIESFIKEMLGEDSSEVELKRNELAEYFGCAPSQINYVLATRFSPSQGYRTESRRGGGGYIRILRITDSEEQKLTWLVRDRIGESLTEDEAVRIIAYLKKNKAVSDEEAAVMEAAVGGRALAIPVTPEIMGALRARILKSMILALGTQENPE